MRPTKYQMMMQIAHVVKMRSTCARLQVGCVISNLELTQILSMGYNGMEAKRAVDAVPPVDSVEDLIRSALGFLADR